jgi:hypothetical protein
MAVGAVLIFTLIVGSGVWLVLRSATAPENTAAPAFEDYDVAEIWRDASAPVDFSSHNEARAYHTAITQGVKDGPNFAGHYRIIEWGCGTACQGHAVVDVRNGRIVIFGLPSTTGLDFRLESRLVVVNPMLQPVPGPRNSRVVTRYLVFDNEEFKSIGEK